jgi:hypothetical protein
VPPGQTHSYQSREPIVVDQVAVEDGAQLELGSSKGVSLKAFRVELGATLKVRITDGVATAALPLLSRTSSTDVCGTGTQALDGQSNRAAPPASAARASSAARPAPPGAPSLHLGSGHGLPADVQALLSTLGIDLDAISTSLLDADGRWLVLETRQALQSNDHNASSDLYHLDLIAERLTLVSASEGGQAGNGPSRYPAADASGELIVFHSDASDLVAGDHNQVSDLFLHDLALGQTRRLTDAEQASANPALDAIGAYLLYDQLGASGQRQVLGQWLLDEQRPAAALSLEAAPDGSALDNHHPAISAGGRYIGYLEHRLGAAEPSGDCQVHLYDRDTQVYHRQPCPEALARAADSARPAFSAEADLLHWHLPGQAEPITLDNPLALPEEPRLN